MLATKATIIENERNFPSYRITLYPPLWNCVYLSSLEKITGCCWIAVGYKGVCLGHTGNPISGRAFLMGDIHWAPGNEEDMQNTHGISQRYSCRGFQWSDELYHLWNVLCMGCAWALCEVPPIRKQYTKPAFTVLPLAVFNCLPGCLPGLENETLRSPKPSHLMQIFWEYFESCTVVVAL